MIDLLTSSLTAAMDRLRQHSDLIGLTNLDEATFRSFVIAELNRHSPDVHCQTEWNRFDLLLQRGKSNVLIEFKFFLSRPLYGLDGKLIRWKGGPGKENEGEFKSCISKLKRAEIEGIEKKFIILAFERNHPRIGSRSYANCYADLSAFGINSAFSIEHSFDNVLDCRLIELTSIE